MSSLLALKRSHFEAAMRAIRRIVRATQLAVDDPTVAYVDLVAALESLSEGTSAPAVPWDRMDPRKKHLVDDALREASPELAKGVREAVMEADRHGAKSKFVAFVMDNVSPEYFRAGAAGSERPVRGADLERGLKLAYDVRSRNLHVLENLPPEAWVPGGRAETVWLREMGTILSLEGLARLARHVVRSYVDRAPAEVDSTFDWRASLPGRLVMESAPQYWIWNAKGFNHTSVDRYFSGFISNLVDAFAGRTDGVTDIRPVLESIEEQVPGLADGEAKALMVAMYALWHRKVVGSDQPDADGLLAEYERLLQPSELPSFVVGVLTDQMPDWGVDEWHALATDRRARRERRIHLELPPGIDAALQVMAAERLLEAGRTDEALELSRYAIEELPGNQPLMDWEAGMSTGQVPKLDLSAIVLALEPDDESGDESPPNADANGSGDKSSAPQSESGDEGCA